MDNRVGQLNSDIYSDWDRVLSDPYLPSKLIRHITVPMKKCVLGAKKCLLNLGHFVPGTSSRSSQQGQLLVDVKIGEDIRREAREQTQDELDLKTQAKEAGNRFCDSLRSRFGEGELVQQVMSDFFYLEVGM